MPDLIPAQTHDISSIQKSEMMPAGHEQMVSVIAENLPAITEGSYNFGRRQSAFMDNMLTVTQPTPLRRARQCLAEIDRALSALRNAHFKYRKNAIKLKKLERRLYKEQDELETELIQIKIEELKSGMAQGQLYVSGAVRKVAQLIEQYNSMLEKAGVDEFTEEAFEKEEEEYHIKTAFTQALTAARSRGGAIDEGNHIYLYQIGINGASAQQDVHSILAAEGKALAEGKTPQHSLVLKWLDEVYNKYKGNAQIYAKTKGLDGTFRPVALIDQAKELLKIAS